jgi:hypothetical protein
LKHGGNIPLDNDILTNLSKEGNIFSMFSLLRKVGQGQERGSLQGERGSLKQSHEVLY